MSWVCSVAVRLLTCTLTALCLSCADSSLELFFFPVDDKYSCAARFRDVRLKYCPILCRIANMSGSRGGGDRRQRRPSVVLRSLHTSGAPYVLGADDDGEDQDVRLVNGEPYVRLRRLSDDEIRQYAEPRTNSGRVTVDVTVPEPKCPPMDERTKAEFEQLKGTCNAEDLDTIICPCQLTAEVSNEVLLLKVNNAMWRRSIGLLVYKIQPMDSGKPSLKRRSLYQLSCIAAYPGSRAHQLPSTSCKAMAELRNHLETAFGGGQLLPGNVALSVLHFTDLEGCILLDAAPPTGTAGIRRIPTREGFVYCRQGPSETVFVLVAAGMCPTCQLGTTAPARVH